MEPPTDETFQHSHPRTVKRFLRPLASRLGECDTRANEADRRRGLEPEARPRVPRPLVLRDNAPLLHPLAPQGSAGAAVDTVEAWQQGGNQNRRDRPKPEGWLRPLDRPGEQGVSRPGSARLG